MFVRVMPPFWWGAVQPVWGACADRKDFCAETVQPFRGLGDQPEPIHIDETEVGDFQMRDHRQR